jgi:translation elongation factor EF-1alpha
VATSENDRLHIYCLCVKQAFNKAVPSAVAGDHVGLLLRNVPLKFVQRGMVLCPPKSDVCYTNRFRAQVYFLTGREGGRKQPVRSTYTQQMFSLTWNIAARLDLPPRELTFVFVSSIVNSRQSNFWARTNIFVMILWEKNIHFCQVLWQKFPFVPGIGCGVNSQDDIQ